MAPAAGKQSGDQVQANRIGVAAAAQVMLKRRRIREDLTEWCRHCGYEPAAHHRLLINRLQAVARGDIKRLAVFMPPGSAKSTYGSILFPPWFLARAPRAAIIAASHTTELAEKMGSPNTQSRSRAFPDPRH
jgi:hypothetical protein